MSRRLPLTQLNADQWQRLFNFAAVVALLIVIAGRTMMAMLGQPIDSRVFYGAGLVVAEGGNPYDHQELASATRQFSAQIGHPRYYSPPWFSLYLATFAAILPFGAARTMWHLLDIVYLAGGTFFSASAVGWRNRDWRFWLAVLAVFYLYGWVAMPQENLGFLLFLFFAAALYAIRRVETDPRWYYDALAGAALALVLVKPQITFLPVGVLSVALWWRRRPIVVWMLATIAALLLLSTLILPGWVAGLLDADYRAVSEFIEDGEVVGERLSTTVVDWLGMLGIKGTVATALWGLVGAISLALLIWAFRSRASTLYLGILAAALGVLITPYAMQYDYPLLSVGLLWVLGRLKRAEGVWRWIGVALLLFALSVPIWEGPVTDGLWLAMTTAILLILLADHGPAFTTSNAKQS